MSETPLPDTGKAATGKAATGKAATRKPTRAAPTPATKTPDAKATPAPVVQNVAVWHNRGLLVGVGAFAALVGIATAIGGVNFPNNAPVESAFAFGIVVDMIAVVVTIVIMIVVETRRRADPVIRALPLYTRASRFAVVALGLAVLTVVAWILGDGPRQLIDLAQGLRARYQFHTAGLFLAGIPWVLSFVFGAWGYRPKANAMTNALGIVAVVISGLLGVVAAIAALVYGADLSD
jgi:hypothetical protein